MHPPLQHSHAGSPADARTASEAGAKCAGCDGARDFPRRQPRPFGAQLPKTTHQSPTLFSRRHENHQRTWLTRARWVGGLSAVGLAVTAGRAEEVAATRSLATASLEELMNVRVTTVARKESTVGQSAAAVFVITQEMIPRSSGGLHLDWQPTDHDTITLNGGYFHHSAGVWNDLAMTSPIRKGNNHLVACIFKTSNRRQISNDCSQRAPFFSDSPIPVTT